MTAEERALRMSGTAGALSQLGDINKPPLRDALDYIRSLITEVGRLERENTKLRRAANLNLDS